METIKLQKEVVITARMVDVDGQPLVGLDIRPASVVVPIEGKPFGNFASIVHDKTFVTTTDADGRFSIGGVSQGHGVYLVVEGNDRVAPQMIALNTGEPEMVADTYRTITRNAKRDEEAVIALAHSKIFEGTIRYSDTKDPIPNAKVSVLSCQDKNSRSMQVDGHSDQNGRYRISAYPGLRFGIQAFAPKGEPYLNRQLMGNAIEWKAGDRVREVDLELSRGVLVRGTITEKGSKIPVVDANIYYEEESASNEHEPYDPLEVWYRFEPYERSDKDGRFEIAVPPGFAHLLITTPGQNHIFKTIGSRNLFCNKDGGTRKYVHAFARIEPRMNAKPLELQITVERGKRISGKIVNLDGTAPVDVTSYSILNVSEVLSWDIGFSDLVINGRFDLGSLADGVEYKIHFLENRLGATAFLTSANDSPTITLEPCGAATIRFVDAEGQPISTGYLVNAELSLVMSPGAYRFDEKFWESGEFEEELVEDVGYKEGFVDGRFTYPALIPGATYVLRVAEDYPNVKTFVAKSGETTDLGEVRISTKE